MRTFLISTIILLSTCSIVSAQADFLAKETGGIEFGFGYSSNDPVEAYLVNLGFCPNGNYEIDILGGQVRAPGFEYVVAQPSITYFVLKQEPGRAVNLGLIGGIELYFLGPGSEASRIETRTLVGGLMSSNARLANAIWFQPAVSLSYFSATGSQKGETIFGLGGSFIIEISSQSFLRLNTSVSFANNDQSYNFSLSFILPEISDQKTTIPKPAQDCDSPTREIILYSCLWICSSQIKTEQVSLS